MADLKKCTVLSGKFVDPCAALTEATEYGHPRGKAKGIFAWEYSSIDKGPTRTMFGVKSGEHVAKGMLFNFCPFCGEKIDAPFAAQVAAPDSQEGAQEEERDPLEQLVEVIEVGNQTAKPEAQEAP